MFVLFSLYDVAVISASTTGFVLTLDHEGNRATLREILSRTRTAEYPYRYEYRYEWIQLPMKLS